MIASFAALIPGVDVVAIPIVVIASAVSIGVDCFRPNMKALNCGLSIAAAVTGVAAPVLRAAIPALTQVPKVSAELWAGLVGTVGFLPQPGTVVYGWATNGK